jgi:hypothetical protein
MAAGSTYTPIATTTVSTTTSTVSFSSISGSYTDLILVSAYGSTNTMYVQFNSDTTSNYSSTILYGTGTTAASTRVSATRIYIGGYWVGSDSGANSNTINTHIQNYSNSTTYKTLLSKSANPSNEVDAIAGLWRSTSAINAITVGVTAGNITIGSTFTLYGIAAA